MKILLLLFVVLFTSYSVQAATLNVPGTYPTIQLGLNAASSGDTILVQPGTYTENIIWPNTSAIVLISAGDTSNTIIDGGGASWVIKNTRGGIITTTTVIDGFKITGGAERYGGGFHFNPIAGITLKNLLITENAASLTAASGGAIYINNLTGNVVMDSLFIRNNSLNASNPGDGPAIFVDGSFSGTPSLTITNSIISYNFVTLATNSTRGGGVYANDLASMTVTDCDISYNTLFGGNTTEGGGIYMKDGDLNLTRVKITNNDVKAGGTVSRGGGVSFDGGIMTGINVLISNNILSTGSTSRSGGGIYFQGTALNLTNCTIAGNVSADMSAYAGGAISTWQDRYTLKNCILWNPVATSEFTTIFGGSPAITTYSDITGGHAGIGNTNIAPVFVGTNDYHLQVTSPCIDAGIPGIGVPTNDLDLATRSALPDMGAYEQNGIALPIELLSFETTCENDNIVLYWVTSSEINNDYFSIQKSTDGYKFSELIIVQGSGNSNNQINYSWIDNIQLGTTVYYRLKQVDFDGKFSYSNIIASSCSNNSLNIYPNPVNDNLFLTIDSFNSNNYEKVLIVNPLGQIIKEVAIEKTSLQISFNDFVKGVYYIQLIGNNQKKITKKIIKN